MIEARMKDINLLRRSSTLCVSCLLPMLHVKLVFTCTVDSVLSLTNDDTPLRSRKSHGHTWQGILNGRRPFAYEATARSEGLLALHSLPPGNLNVAGPSLLAWVLVTTWCLVSQGTYLVHLSLRLVSSLCRLYRHRSSVLYSGYAHQVQVLVS